METKAWYKSKGIWGGVITVAALLLNMAFGEGTVSEAELTAIAGGILAIVGRIMGTSQISLK